MFVQWAAGTEFGVEVQGYIHSHICLLNGEAILSLLLLLIIVSIIDYCVIRY